MLWGRTAWGGAPWTRDAYVDLSTLPPSEALLADPDSERVHIATLSPYDPALPGVVTKAFADAAWEVDTPAAPTRVAVALDVESSILDAGALGVASGPSIPRVGGIMISADESANGPGELAASDVDALTGYWWDGRAVEVRVLGPTFPYADGKAIFRGFSLDAVWSRKGVEVVLRDPALRLRVPMVTERFLGTGGAEGGDDLKGQTKPWCVGGCYNVTPAVVDRANSVLCFHHGASAQLVFGARDQGIAWTPHNGGANDVADLALANVWAWTPVAGQFVTDLAHGLVRHGSALVGDPTLDVLGDADPTLGGWVYSPARIFERIVRQRAGLADADIDLQSLADLDLLTAGACGLYVGTGEGETEVTAYLEQILPGTVLGFWELTRLGLVRVAALGFGVIARTIQASDIDYLERVRTQAPIFRHLLGYRRAWTQQDASDLALAAPDAFRDFVSQPIRYPAPSEDLSIEALRGLPGDFTGDSLFANEADAVAEQARRLALTKVQRDRYEITFRRHQFLLRLGDTVRVVYPQWGLSAGRDFVVLALSENTSTKRTTATLWGSRG